MWKELYVVCDNKQTGCHFIKNEKHLHINYLEQLRFFNLKDSKSFKRTCESFIRQ